MDSQGNIIQNTPTVNTTPQTPDKSNGIIKWIGGVLLAVVVGIFIGYFLRTYLPIPSTSVQKPEKQLESASETIVLPKDAVQIQSCSDNSGSLYVQPKDIPMGPVYMVSSGKVIGVKYMIPKDALVNGKNFDYLPGTNVKVNHVNIGLLESGHLGMTQPHYHVSLYSVDKSVEQGITCAEGTTEESPLMDIHESSDSASSSLSPQMKM